ncbi:hypothetical protein [Methylobacterium sp. D48H]
MADRRIYPEAAAERLKKHAGQPYRPSNGSEGEYFAAVWCSGCSRRHGFAGQGCMIFVASMAHGINEPGYPEEWQYGADGQPGCTGFRDATVRARVARCGWTADLFSLEAPRG